MLNGSSETVKTPRVGIKATCSLSVILRTFATLDGRLRITRRLSSIGLKTAAGMWRVGNDVNIQTAVNLDTRCLEIDDGGHEFSITAAQLLNSRSRPPAEEAPHWRNWGSFAETVAFDAGRSCLLEGKPSQRDTQSYRVTSFCKPSPVPFDPACVRHPQRHRLH